MLQYIVGSCVVGALLYVLKSYEAKTASSDVHVDIARSPLETGSYRPENGADLSVLTGAPGDTYQDSVVRTMKSMQNVMGTVPVSTPTAGVYTPLALITLPTTQMPKKFYTLYV